MGVNWAVYLDVLLCTESFGISRAVTASDLHCSQRSCKLNLVSTQMKDVRQPSCVR